MKRLLVFTLALVLTTPLISRAQTDESDQSKQQYRDEDDAQLLKLVSYILTPAGMALEWGLMRPLHHLATQTSAAPILSGDNQPSFFTENNNASKVPPGTFAPPPVNMTNNLEPADNLEASNNKPQRPGASTLAPAESIPPSKPLISGGQPALH
jgi:hypothetical protein